MAVWKLGDNAYGVTIRDLIKQATGVDWIFGAIYSPLGRLVDMGLVESYSSSPIPERGGRSKVIYRLTNDGKDALLEIQEVNKTMWSDVPPLKGEF